MFKELYISGVSWTVKESVDTSILDNLFPRLSSHEMHPELALVKDNNVRSAFFFTTGCAVHHEVFVKRYKCRGIKDILKHLFVPSKAVSEWRNLKKFADRQLPCPEPLAFSEKKTLGILRDSCLITEVVTSSVPLNEYLKNMPVSLQKKNCLTKSLAALIRVLHENRVFFRDLHAGNILVKPTGSCSPDLYFIDLHRALVIPWLLTWMKIKDLAQLCNSLTASKTDRIRFLKEYCKEERLVNNSFRILQEKIYSKSLKLELRRIKSRSKRCFKSSSVFEKQITRTEAYYGRRDFGRKKADSLVLKSIEDSSSTIKISSKSVITAHKTEDGSLVCVKRYKFRGTAYLLKNLFRKSRAMKSWIAANGLVVRGISTPLPQAMVEKKRGLLCIESYYISQWLPEAAELNDYINMLKSRHEKELFIGAFARVIRQVHLKKIFHADLKSNNILVTADGNNRWSFYFIDLDRVSFNKELTFYQRANNLAQINASISDLMTVKDRLKFFRLYAEGTCLFCERKKYYKKILEISRTKITEPYGITFT